MGKLREKKQKRKEEKRASKFGTNPTTGKALTKREKKKVDRYGYNEDGGVNSKKQNKQSRKDRRFDIKDSKVENKRIKAQGRADAKLVRSQGRATKKEGKAEKLAAQGEADLILANQGIDSQAARREATMKGLTDITQNAAEGIANIYGGGMTNGMKDNYEDETESSAFKNNENYGYKSTKEEDNYEETTNNKKKISTPLIIGIIGGIIALVGIAFMALKNNNNGKKSGKKTY